VRDQAAIAALVADADVVVHLAATVSDAPDQTPEASLEASQNVFAAAIDRGCMRLVYASSVAAYGHDDDDDAERDDRPQAPLTEDHATHATERHNYSAQKAQLERALAAALVGAHTAAYVMRPCLVAGPDACTLMQAIPYVQLSDEMPEPVRDSLELMPVLRPVLLDSGLAFQLIHHDDVASALRAAVLGRGTPGLYNLAGPGTVTLSDLADALGWYSVRAPELPADLAAELTAQLPFVPPEAEWIESLRKPVLMDTSKARRELRWRPRHNARDTLRAMVELAAAERLIR
jgi:nucleoside-diphosphate-sugar epimerase